MDKLTALKQYFGHASFRDGQESLVDAAIGGRDVFGVMPTGGGKSLCYQLPAILLPGITLVISPLISLMKDQVTALAGIGIDAAFINSSLSAGQIAAACANLRSGRYKIVYVAPERLVGDGFAAALSGVDVSMVAVDEAHCISQWGQDFRPSYVKIPDFLEKLPRRPILAAFTATATERVRGDIERILKLRDPLRLITGFDRPNLNFEVLKPRSKSRALHDLLGERRGKSGIVYCATRDAVERVCGELCASGYSATRYHAGLRDEERRQNQEDFLHDRSTVMVATNAFGMGIDKSNVSFVVHYNMPKSLEAYYQEAGRAGRDGEKADCVLLFSLADIATAKFLIQKTSENSELDSGERRLVLRQDYERLDTMVGYCKTANCLRGYVLDYFGQTHGDTCGNCGNCRADMVEIDLTDEAQKILSCVQRVKNKLGYSVGATLIEKALRGSREKRVLQLGLDKLSTYGLMSRFTSEQVRGYIDRLDAVGYLRTDPEHGAVELTAAANEVLFRGEKVSIRIVKADAKKPSPTQPAGEDSGLFGALKALRFKLAQDEGVPAYIVFSNAALSDMAQKAPRNLEEFMTVSGVGAVKAERYADAFLRAIAEFEGVNVDEI